ncbi:uncharacterized protein [Neodiprion pinetum]|uniref:uncharacterized protein n=1 Tax=Neodiprion pinetum TaxID=441929 RepID=UPI00370FA3FA
MSISGVGGEFIDRSQFKSRLQIHLPDLDSPVDFEVYCIKRLGLSTPTTQIPQNVRELWRPLQLADEHFDTPGPVDILIGANLLPTLMRSGVLRKDTTMAQNTAVGWIISGCIAQPTTSTTTRLCLTQAGVEPHWYQQLFQLIQRFWEIENVPHVVRQSPDDKICETIFSQHRRDAQGRYIVPLPVRTNLLHLLGESLLGALASLTALLRRMKRDSALARACINFMNEYLRCGHMRELPEEEIHQTDSPIYYIPFHGIWQRGDLEQKLRVVFNASRSTSSGYSLNDVLYTGPKLQTTLWRVLVIWRIYQIAFSTDAQMMYRQIRIAKEHLNLQRIVWSPHEDLPVKHYQLLTVTYGTSCAPYLALRVMKQLCDDEKEGREDAARALLHERYIDDIFSGADNIPDALRLRDQMIQLAQAGGFPLRKWVANTPELLQDLPPEMCLRPSWVRIGEDGPVNELGIHWDPQADNFRLAPPQLAPVQRTKREILAAVASIFDPCGWLAPVTLLAKMLMQDLWRAGLDWDQPLPASMSRRWDSFKENLGRISEVSIPRWLKTSPGHAVELHAFSDASRRAMAAAVNIRISQDQSVHTALLIAKTKLASIKSLRPKEQTEPRMTIPRLELRAALIAVKLLRTVAKDLKIPSDNCYAWTDSKIALHWICSDKPVGNSLVDNYVNQIQETFPRAAWRHVFSELNPVDVATRGAELTQLLHERSWFDGPTWLSNPSTWKEIPSHPTPEAVTSHATVVCENLNLNPSFVNKFSRLLTLLRFLVRLRRWIRIRLQRTPTAVVLGPMTAVELHEAFLACVQLSQSQYFASEIASLRSGNNHPNHSVLRGLAAHVDSKGILRVGGRLQHSPLSYDERHPPILSGTDHLAWLIINWAHEKSLHGGFRSTYVQVVRRAWIIGGVHLELVGDLATESLQAALERFTKRRGKPEEIWSDNAAHFHRADREMKQALRSLNWDQVADALATEGITWKFIPPAASHFGGLWEAGVKSFKRHLERVAGPRNLTYEEFSTLLIGIEAVLNRRPLSPLSSDLGDLEVLTAGHLLVGRHLGSIPEVSADYSNLDHLTH